MARLTFLAAFPFAVLLVLVIALGLSSRLLAGVPLIVVGVVAFVASMFLAYSLASRPLRTVLAQEPFRCSLCGERFPRESLQDHVRERHPNDMGYLRVLSVGNHLGLFVILGMFTLVALSLIQFYEVVQSPRSPDLYLGFFLVLVYGFAVLAVTAFLGTWWSKRLHQYHDRAAAT